MKKINYQNRIFASQGIKMKLQRKDCENYLSASKTNNSGKTFETA